MNNLTLLYQLQEVESDNDSYLNDSHSVYICPRSMLNDTRIVALLIFEVERHKYIINNNSTL